MKDKCRHDLLDILDDEILRCNNCGKAWKRNHKGQYTHGMIARS